MTDTKNSPKRNKKGELIPKATSDHMKWVVDQRWKKKKGEVTEKQIVNETHVIMVANLFEEDQMIKYLMESRGLSKWEAERQYVMIKEEAENQKEDEKNRNLIEMAAKTASEHPLLALLTLGVAKYSNFDISTLTAKKRKITRYPKNPY